MAIGDLNYNTNNKASSTPVKKTFTFMVGSDLIDSDTIIHQFAIPFSGRLTDVQMSLSVTGAVASGFTEIDVKKATVSMLATLGKIEVTAAAASIVRVGGAAGTGLTHPILETAALIAIDEDEVLSFEVESNGTFTTQPEGLTVVLEFIEEQDFDPIL